MKSEPKMCWLAGNTKIPPPICGIGLGDEAGPVAVGGPEIIGGRRQSVAGTPVEQICRATVLESIG
jgi:hypothetical protein